MERVHGVPPEDENEGQTVTDPSKMPKKPAKAEPEDEKPEDSPAEEEKPGEKADDEAAKDGKSAKEADDDEPDEDDDSDYGKKVKKRIARETYKRREVERRLAEASAELERLRHERSQSATQLTSSQEMALSAHEERLKAERERLKRDYRDAVERGDSEKLFEVEEQIADVRVELKRLGFLRDEMKARRPAQADDGAQDDTGQATAPAPRQQPRPSQKAVDWAAQNKAWFGPNRAMTAAAYGIDADLKEEGYDANSDDFYSELTRRVRELFPTQFPKRHASSSVAGVDRQPARRGGGKPTPTEGQRAMAARLGVPIAEYMKYVPKD